MLTLPINASREIFQVFFLRDSYQAKIPQVIKTVFFICGKSPSLLYLPVFFPDSLRSCDRKFAFSLIFASEHVQGVTEVSF